MVFLSKITGVICLAVCSAVTGCGEHAVGPAVITIGKDLSNLELPLSLTCDNRFTFAIKNDLDKTVRVDVKANSNLVLSMRDTSSALLPGDAITVEGSLQNRKVGFLSVRTDYEPAAQSALEIRERSN